MTDEKILKRIERLLAMAKDSSSPNEAAIAARRAATLMAKHNLEEADVILDEMTDDDIVDIMADAGATQITHWMMRFAVPVAKLMDCDARVYRSGKRKIVTYLGQKEDAQVAAWVYVYLVDQVKLLSKKYRAQMRKQFGAGHGTNMGDYREGITEEILNTLWQMKKEKEAALAEHVTGTALVVRKQDLIEKKFGETEYSKGKSRQLNDANAYYAGKRDGKNVRINPALNDSSEKQGRLR